MTEFSETGPPVTKADVDAFEAEIDSPLPEDYRRFLLTTNGGVPSDNTVDEPSQEIVGIEGFFCLGVESGELSMAGALRVWNSRYPATMLAIAACEGSCLLLTLDGDHVGEVLYWDHDGEAQPDEPPTNDNLSHVADAFTELLDSLYTWDDMGRPEIQRMRGSSGGNAWIDPDFSPGRSRRTR
jgi:hypothetical protein